jgi:hypothetical protein
MTTTTITHDVDTLGSLLAQIAALTKRADAIKDAIKNDASLGGDKVLDGESFRATYIETNRSTINWLGIVAAKVGVEILKKEDTADSWAKVAVALGIEAKALPKAIADNTKTSAVYTVKVTSL